MSRHPLTMTMGASEWRSAPMSEEIIEAYRETGDEVTRNVIIKHHIALVIGMAGNYARRLNRHQNLDVVDRTDELASVGLTALAQAVVWCGPHLNKDGEFEPSRLRDNNIEPYIKSTVRSWIRRAISEDRVVSMPSRTFRKRIADGEQVEGPNVYSIDEMQDEVSKHGIYTIPLAKQEYPSLDFEEALNLAILTDRERRVIDLRREGHTYASIADLLGLSVSLIGRIVAPVEERFLRIYA
jgi:DNA-directed RNA polymerase specialized sigma subunit